MRLQTEALTNKFPKQRSHHSPTPPPISPEQVLYDDGQIRKCWVSSSLAHRLTAPEESGTWVSERGQPLKNEAPAQCLTSATPEIGLPVESRGDF